jgi:biopolymer transport protein ExbD
MTSKKKRDATRAVTRALPEEDPEFQIAPMIDILLVLLVFFMTIATDQVLQQNQEVILPVAKEAEKPDKENVSVYVNVLWALDGNGRIEVDSAGQMELAALTEYIIKKRVNAEVTGNSAKFQVIIRGDKRAKVSVHPHGDGGDRQCQSAERHLQRVDKEVTKKPAGSTN